jgi:hypothetical protein
VTAITNREALKTAVHAAVRDVRLTDIHTHVYTPCFGKLLLWGIDELLTYHYLVAETFRWIDMPYEDFWAMPKRAQADLIWQTLFVDNTPYSEATRGVLTVLARLGLDVTSRDLNAYRAHFDAMTTEQYVDTVFAVAGVKDVVMTNDPFDTPERKVWEDGHTPDPRFRAALRIDALLNTWDHAFIKLEEWGYDVEDALTRKTMREVRRFLNDWIERMDALYLAVSLLLTFAMPEESTRGILIRECVLPVCREKNIPFALMIGVKKLVNADLRLAGDSVGCSDIEAVEHLCEEYPENKFMVTMLARENQHELCVAARKFRNLLPFGCWWFLNNPSIIQEMTRMRLELLGSSMIPQHSDARVLDQLVYKWDHSRTIISDVLTDKYADILATGWHPTTEEITRDVERLFGGNFWEFLRKKL